jgi:hypothetical protein
MRLSECVLNHSEHLLSECSIEQGSRSSEEKGKSRGLSASSIRLFL